MVEEKATARERGRVHLHRPPRPQMPWAGVPPSPALRPWGLRVVLAAAGAAYRLQVLHAEARAVAVVVVARNQGRGRWPGSVRMTGFAPPSTSPPQRKPKAPGQPMPACPPPTVHHGCLRPGLRVSAVGVKAAAHDRGPRAPTGKGSPGGGVPRPHPSGLSASGVAVEGLARQRWFHAGLRQAVQRGRQQRGPKT